MKPPSQTSIVTDFPSAGIRFRSERAVFRNLVASYKEKIRFHIVGRSHISFQLKVFSLCKYLNE